MACRDLFNSAYVRRASLDAPVRIHPRCHPKAGVDVFVDTQNHSVILVCSRCDRTIACVKAAPFSKKIE